MKKCDRCKDECKLYLLVIACDLLKDELNIPFYPVFKDSNFYNMNVCERCLAQWLVMVNDWYHHIDHVKKVKSGLYLRIDGKLKEVTPKEFHKKLKEIKS